MAKAKQEDGDMIVIKKYANRRLYNTQKSSYVTLEDLAQMVRDGDDFVVRDARSGDEITRAVLTQIIFEEEAKGQTMLPANFLRQLIRLYGDTLQGVVPGYLEASMETFSSNQEKLREQMSSAFGTNPAMKSLEAMTRANMDIYENAIRMFSPFAGRTDDATPEVKPQEEETASELDDLKDQLTKMQNQLSKLVKDT